MEKTHEKYHQGLLAQVEDHLDKVYKENSSLRDENEDLRLQVEVLRAHIRVLVFTEKIRSVLPDVSVKPELLVVPGS